MLLSKTGLLLAAATVLSGCMMGDPRSYESTPVEVDTAKGVVTCQLYTRERVLWDRSINRPGNMSVEEADNVCLAAGQRWKDGA